ncbi:MAG: hypothetical protein HYX34_06950 [Actinobacteria bacterium]|nr:hypothetical protein [Actinomycetota bacterium]
MRDNSLAIAVFTLFFVTLLFGQGLAGWRTYNSDQKDHRQSAVSFPRYLTTANFGEATFENWESEFLQMGAYVLLTVWLRQRGSSESKPMEGDDDVDEDPRSHRLDPEAPGPVRRGGFSLVLYKNSLSIAFFALFFASWGMHAVTGARDFSQQQLAHGGQAVSIPQFLTRGEFWFQSFQNWQSEFLAVASLVVFTIWFRQQGSPESKPVHAPHRQTGSS